MQSRFSHLNTFTFKSSHMLLCAFTLCFRLNNKSWSNIEFLFFPCVILNLHLQRVCNQMRSAADKLSINSSGKEVCRRRLLLRRRLSHNHRRLKQGALNAAIMGNICWLNHRLCIEMLKRRRHTAVKVLSSTCWRFIAATCSVPLCRWCFPAHVSMMNCMMSLRQQQCRHAWRPNEDDKTAVKMSQQFNVWKRRSDKWPIGDTLPMGWLLGVFLHFNNQHTFFVPSHFHNSFCLPRKVTWVVLCDASLSADIIYEHAYQFWRPPSSVQTIY